TAGRDLHAGPAPRLPRDRRMGSRRTDDQRRADLPDRQHALRRLEGVGIRARRDSLRDGGDERDPAPGDQLRVIGGRRGDGIWICDAREAGACGGGRCQTPGKARATPRRSCRCAFRILRFVPRSRTATMKILHLALALCAMTLVSTSHAQVPMQHWQGLAIGAITSAEKGTVRDMVRAGHYYRTGFGVHRDWTQAVRWYTQAARAGDANAAYWAGKLYLERQRYGEAREWFARAVALSLEQVQASWELGQLYLHGLGVEQDTDRAAAHLFNAAAF